MFLCLQPSIYLRLLSAGSSPQTPKAGLRPSSPLSPSPCPSPAGSMSSPAWSPSPQPQHIHSIIPLGVPQVYPSAAQKEFLNEGDSLDQTSSYSSSSSSSSSLSTPTLTERHQRQQHLEEQIEQVTCMQCSSPTTQSTSEPVYLTLLKICLCTCPSLSINACGRCRLKWP